VLDLGAVQGFAHDSLAAIADPATAAGMASYMRSTMPCYGVTRPKTKPILRELCDRWPPTSAAEYRILVEALWALPHREAKYLAIGMARAHDRFVTRGSIPLYRRMIVSGAWWDFVDEIAIRLVGRALDKDPEHITPTIRRWIDHPDPWLRRTAIICQVARKESTDSALLFEACARRSQETDFFIRKAIGWALRSYAYTDPAAVRRFVSTHAGELSGLSRREATKHL
jgi:3-methyladenine DNA glycosylase AlkD